MKQAAPNCSEEVGAWTMEKLGRTWVPDSARAIGQWDWELHNWVAGVLFYEHNGRSVKMAVAAEGGRWMTKAYLWMCFDYPFNQLGVGKIIAEVSQGNTRSRQFVTRVGFHLEATLKDADPDGDLLLYTMSRDQCRWLNIRGSFNGQRQHPQGPEL